MLIYSRRDNGLKSGVKFCGVTRPEDVRAAVDLHVDFLGFIFDPKSPRCITKEQAYDLTFGLTLRVHTVALFANASKSEVEQVLAYGSFSLLQFHGDETDEFCAQFEVPFWKAIRVKEDTDITAEVSRYPSAKGIVLDAYDSHANGGTGMTFNWDKAKVKKPLSLILAGGLNAQNVGKAIEKVHPFCVDVCSGIEDAPGIKSVEKMKAFIEGCR